MPTRHIDKISTYELQITWKRYTDTAPSALTELDKLRYHTIPNKLAKTKKDAYLQKADLEKLVEWKLYVGLSNTALLHSRPLCSLSSRERECILHR
jgi:hypothetical protein